MKAVEQDNPTSDDRRRGDARSARVGERVIRAIGRPAALYAVQARNLWADCYRVNVLVGPDVTATRIAHSYFLRVDEDGTILAATPPLARLYATGE